MPPLKRHPENVYTRRGNGENRTDLLEALNAEATLHLSVRNIGEVLGALDGYPRRGWLGRKEHKVARESFITEKTRLVKPGVAKLVPVKSSLPGDSRPLVEKHHIHEADALQIVSAKHLNADQLLTGDQRLADISHKEAVNATYLGSP